MADSLFDISLDAARIDRAFVHRWLSEESYWAKGRTREASDRALDHSLLCGAWRTADGAQVGFARAVTDYATFAWIADVFVIPEARGKGVATAMMKALIEHPDLAACRRIVLATRDAHAVYAPLGFAPMKEPERWMERRRT